MKTAKPRPCDIFATVAQIAGCRTPPAVGAVLAAALPEFGLSQSSG